MIEACNYLILTSFYAIAVMFLCRMTRHFFDKRIMFRAIISLVSAFFVMGFAIKTIKEVFWPAIDLEPLAKGLGIMMATLPAAFLVPPFNDWLEVAEKKLIELEIFAKDSNEWGEEWREGEVKKHIEEILEKSDAIQEDWIQNRHKKFVFFPLIAQMFWCHDVSVVRAWLIADRDENYKQLELAREIQKGRAKDEPGK